MQLWAETDATMYTANWDYNTCTKFGPYPSTNMLWETNVGVPVQIGFLLGWALGSGLPLHSAAMAPVATSKRPGRSSQPKSSVAIVSALCECECACACMRGYDVSTFMCTGEDK